MREVTASALVEEESSQYLSVSPPPGPRGGASKLGYTP